MIKLLAIWTALSVTVGFIIAPALSRRLRNRNSPPENE
jgi:hypothetical protein